MPPHMQTLFRLEPCWVHWCAGLELDSFDPKWPSVGCRPLALPGRDIIVRMQLSRVPLTLCYTDLSNRESVLCETWHDYSGTDRERADYVEGYRLVVRDDLLRQYLIQKNSWLVFTVRIRRQRPSRWMGEYRSEYDPGVVKALIFTHEGELLGC